MLDAAEICVRKIKSKEASIRQEDDDSFSHKQMVQQSCQEETTNSEHPLETKTNRKERRFQKITSW